MKSSKAENASSRIKVFPRTHKKLKVLAAKGNQTMAELIEQKFFSLPSPDHA